MPPRPPLPILRSLRTTDHILNHPPIRRHLHPRPSSTSTLPKTPHRGPPSTETTQTDFSTLDVFANAPAPAAAIDACLSDGFHLDNGVKIGGGSGVVVVGGEAFAWRPWGRGRGGERGRLINGLGQWDGGGGGDQGGVWGVLEVVWPKPDLLILGLGPGVHPIAPETRKFINGLGIRVDVQDTRNAAAQFNLLATERGVGNVAAALIPIGWKEPK